MDSYDNNEKSDGGDKKPAAEQSSRWRKLWQPPGARYWLGIPAGGFMMFAVGIVFWGGFNTAMELTSTLGFCTSCHEMTPVYEEYQQSIHYKNASGVRAICSDCHVPKPWGSKVLRKIKATFNEVPHAIMGTIDTPEKFEAHRAEMAENVWAEMRSNDSRECRNCHTLETMALEVQDKSARRRHTLERKQKKGETCIDCHQGIAHKLPEGYE
ncbi:MAG: Denitrification system component NirT [Gammaproteobacteria bacterium]|nr:Denitrification system component NirT [Gammaproteobacteria bacterium]MCP4984239.1 Denitrification system component NirT [Gammaproteobacteria bacterium]